MTCSSRAALSHVHFQYLLSFVLGKHPRTKENPSHTLYLSCANVLVKLNECIRLTFKINIFTFIKTDKLSILINRNSNSRMTLFSTICLPLAK